MARRMEEEEYLEYQMACIKWEGREEGWRTGGDHSTRQREENSRARGKSWLEWWEKRRRDRRMRYKFWEAEASLEWLKGEWEEWNRWMEHLSQPNWGMQKWETKRAEEEARYEIRVDEVGQRQMIRISMMGEQYKWEERQKREKELQEQGQQDRQRKRPKSQRGRDQAGTRPTWEQRLEIAAVEREGILARTLLQWNGREEMSMASRRREIAEQGMKRELRDWQKDREELQRKVDVCRRRKEGALQRARDWTEQEVRADWDKIRREWWQVEREELERMRQRMGNPDRGTSTTRPQRRVSMLQRMEWELKGGNQQRINAAGKKMEYMYRWKGLRGLEDGWGVTRDRRKEGYQQQDPQGGGLKHRLEKARRDWKQQGGQNREEEERPVTEQREELKEPGIKSAQPEKQEREQQKGTQQGARTTSREGEDRGARRRRVLRQKKEEKKQKGKNKRK